MNKTVPLTPAVFYILLALFNGERHGYDIMRQVRLDSGGRVNMGPGTLYGSIDRMIAAGLVSEAKQVQSEARRIYYKLTAHGRSVFQAETERLEHAAKIARGRLLKTT